MSPTLAPPTTWPLFPIMAIEVYTRNVEELGIRYFTLAPCSAGEVEIDCAVVSLSVVMIMSVACS